MKKIVLIALLAVSTSAVFAQTPGPTGGTATPIAGKRPDIQSMMKARKEVMDSLNLSADQKSKLEASDKEYADKLKAIMAERKAAGKGGNKGQAKEDMKSLREWEKQQMTTILSKQQMRAFHQGLAKWMKDHGFAQGKPTAGGKPPKV